MPASTSRCYDFNAIIGVDLLFIMGVSNYMEHPVLNITCHGIMYSTFVLVEVNRRGAGLVWRAFAKSWLRLFGEPSYMVMDQGTSSSDETSKKD